MPGLLTAEGIVSRNGDARSSMRAYRVQHWSFPSSMACIDRHELVYGYRRERTQHVGFSSKTLRRAELSHVSAVLDPVLARICTGSRYAYELKLSVCPRLHRVRRRVTLMCSSPETSEHDRRGLGANNPNARARIDDRPCYERQTSYAWVRGGGKLELTPSRLVPLPAANQLALCSPKSSVRPLTRPPLDPTAAQSKAP